MLKMAEVNQNLLTFGNMKKSKSQLSLLIATLICLVVLVAIQINWIMKAAKMQEAQFNHSVDMAMNRIMENLSRDQEICMEVSNCLREGGSCYLLMKNREEWSNMGTMIRKDLSYYGIDLDFEFDIVEINPENKSKKENTVFVSVDLVNVLKQSGYELRIKFPEKRDFIMAQIGYIFIFSIALIILITLSFILIFGYFKKEKRLTENIVDFINNMTHEFKTPLTNIALANSMISKTDKVENDEKLSFYSKVIRTEHDKLKQRVEELLKTSFTETGQPAFNENIDAALVIENVIETYSVQISDKEGTFKYDKKGSDFTIKGNTDMFHIAMGNLVDNAIKYCEVIPQINFYLHSDESRLKIEISDNGIGISKEQLPLIFDKYYRIPTGNVHNNNGFGLGLYHVRNIIIKMNGKIGVSSTKGKGTVFTIELPIQSK